MQRIATTVLLLVIVLAAPSCKRKARPRIPATVPQAPAPALPEASAEPKTAPPEPAELEAPPAIEPPASEPPIPLPPVSTEAPVAPPPPPVKLLAPPPQLAPLLSAEERSRYAVETAASLARARRRVAAMDQRKLSGDQEARLNRIRTFIEQASLLRNSDLVTAHGLARRADVLSRELDESTQ